MIEEIEKPSKRKKTNYVSPVIAVTSLLFVLGLSIHFVYQSSKLTDAVKEQQAIRIELTDDADIAMVQQTLQANDFVSKITFVSKAEGWQEMKGEMKKDPALLLDENPLPNLLIVQVKAAQNTPAQISQIKANFEKIIGVQAVDYKEADLKLVDKIIGKLSLAGLILIAILFLIAVYLIASTIRLAIFSQRFIIRSMQLVGATRWFIIRPFILKSLFNGFLSGCLASGFITALYFLIEQYFPKWNIFQPLPYFVGSLICLVLLGMLLTVIFSWVMVSRYLRMKLDELY